LVAEFGAGTSRTFSDETFVDQSVEGDRDRSRIRPHALAGAPRNMTDDSRLKNVVSATDRPRQLRR
jgi:hypothetical protein